jgi:hypothetical protein
MYVISCFEEMVIVVHTLSYYLSYYEEDRTHPLNLYLFQCSFLKYSIYHTASLLKIFLTQLSDYTHRVWGRGGGGGSEMSTSDTTSRRTAKFLMISAETPCWEIGRK